MAQLTEAQKLIGQRRVARRLAMLGTYQWLMTGNSFHEVYTYYQEDKELAADFRKADAAFVHKLLRCAIESGEAIEAALASHLDRKLSQLDMIEHAVLRVATCELLNHPEIPVKVVVSEAVNLTKKFGGEGGHKYINGVLDKVAKQARPLETK